MFKLVKSESEKKMYVYIDNDCVDFINYNSVQDLFEILNKKYHNEFLREN